MKNPLRSKRFRLSLIWKDLSTKLTQTTAKNCNTKIRANFTYVETTYFKVKSKRKCKRKLVTDFCLRIQLSPDRTTRLYTMDSS